MIATPGPLAGCRSLEAMKVALAELDMMAGWNKHEPSLWAAPRTAFRPMHWSWSVAREGLAVAGRLISAEQADRRNFFLVNPVEGNHYATLRTLVCAYQMILPGERAPSHRHSPNALRLVLEGGADVYTVVDGVRIDMQPGDVVLTPGWSWHGHGDDGDRRGAWIDFLDVPLVHLLEPMFFEHWPGPIQAASERSREGPYVFPLARTRTELAQARRDEFERLRVVLEAPSIATLTLDLQALEPDRSPPALRTTANQIVAVVTGRGTTTVGGVSFDWEPGDVLALPAWQPFRHRASESAILFGVSDERAQRALRFWRCERADTTGENR